MIETITETDLDLPLYYRGKVRDCYLLNGNILMVATDRMSAFDVVFREGIPFKGKVLNQISAFWFEKTKHVIGNHLISMEMPTELPTLLRGRSMIVEKTNPIKVECVVRGYLAGSAEKEYISKGEVCGIKFPKGLKKGDKLPKPIFTPATKTDTGHDINLTYEEAKKIVGEEKLEFLKEKSLEVYDFAHRYLLSRGLILADTKFEFGESSDEIILIDEVLTPDSSRYWLESSYRQGILENFDKQPLRDYLETTSWNKTPPPPPLPPEIVQSTSKRYVDAFRMITGHDLL